MRSVERIIYSTILLLFTLAPGSIQAQTGKISGFVFSGSYQNKVPGIIINLKEQGKGAITDSNGHYSINNLPDGDYAMKFSGLGFKPAEHKVKIKNGSTVFYSSNIDEAPLNLKEVVITQQYDAKSIGGYNIMSQIDIGLRPANSAQDLLRLVPGLFIAQHAGGGKAEQIFLRGFDCDHGTDFASFVDGIPVNMVSHAHGQGYADMHFVIPETIKEIDVYKGPYNSKFGDLATSGAGEFKTFNILDRNQIRIEYGQFNTYRALVMLNLLNDKTHIFSDLKENLYVASEYRYTDSYFDNPQHFSRFNGLIKYYGQLSSQTNMTFSVSSFISKWDASGQIPERAVSENIITKFGSLDPSEGGNTSRTNINLVFDHNYDENHRIKNQFYYSKYDFNLYSNFTFYKNDPVHGDEINQLDHRNMLGYNGTYDMNANVLGFKTKIAFGIGARYDNAHVSLIHDEKRIALDTFTDGILNQLNTNAYVDGNIFLTSKFRINPGLRFDVFNFNFKNIHEPGFSGDVVKARISPKLNFFYDFNPAIETYIKTGIGFHSNDARAVIINQVNGINDNVLPGAYGADLGALFKPTPDIIINLSVWTIYLENELVYSGDDGTVNQEGATLRKGTDLGIRYEFLKHFYIDADLNYSYGRRLNVPSDSVYIPLAPLLTSVAGISYKSETGFNGSLRYRYLGDRPANEAWSRTASGYFIMDAMINYTPRVVGAGQKRWEIGLSIENIFNVYWKEAQFDTESRLKGESSPVTEINYTPGTPRSIKGHLSFWF